MTMDHSLFQSRQCLDLLETNVAPKRPIEGERIHSHESYIFSTVRWLSVLVGKMNLEVRPVAVNKGEIVKRLMYQNPNAEFVFCAGDDKVNSILCSHIG